jgi:hypothetical protein
LESSRQKMTDADFERFRDAYRAELGNFKSKPASPWAFFSTYGEFGQSMQAFRGTKDEVPMPFVFERASGLIILQIDQQAGAPKATVAINGQSIETEIPLKNLKILTKSGKTMLLFDPASTLGGTIGDSTAPADSSSPDPKASVDTSPQPPTPPVAPKDPS